MPESSFLPAPPVSVAITGTLSIPRAEAARLINSSKNAQFVPSVTYHTSYLVSALPDSQKVRKAREIGVTIISEAQLFDYLKHGTFPPAKTHDYHRPAPPPFDVDWTTTYAEPRHVLIKYTDADQQYSEREAEVFGEGKSPAGITYFNILDEEGFKTFRADRIVEMVEISNEATIQSEPSTLIYRAARWLAELTSKFTKRPQEGN
jgi:hypothetical protein